MTPLPRLALSHSAPISSRPRFLCSADMGRTSFAERRTGYSAESLAIAGNVEAVCLPSRAFRGSRTERVLVAGAAEGLNDAKIEQTLEELDPQAGGGSLLRWSATATV
jgi:hypothetical protein